MAFPPLTGEAPTEALNLVKAIYRQWQAFADAGERDEERVRAAMLSMYATYRSDAAEESPYRVDHFLRRGLTITQWDVDTEATGDCLRFRVRGSYRHGNETERFDDTLSLNTKRWVVVTHTLTADIPASQGDESQSSATASESIPEPSSESTVERDVEPAPEPEPVSEPEPEPTIVLPNSEVPAPSNDDTVSASLRKTVTTLYDAWGKLHAELDGDPKDALDLATSRLSGYYTDSSALARSLPSAFQAVPAVAGARYLPGEKPCIYTQGRLSVPGEREPRTFDDMFKFDDSGKVTYMARCYTGPVERNARIDLPKEYLPLKESIETLLDAFLGSHRYHVDNPWGMARWHPRFLAIDSFFPENRGAGTPAILSWKVLKVQILPGSGHRSVDLKAWDGSIYRTAYSRMMLVWIDLTCGSVETMLKRSDRLAIVFDRPEQPTRIGIYSWTPDVTE